ALGAQRYISITPDFFSVSQLPTGDGLCAAAPTTKPLSNSAKAAKKLRMIRFKSGCLDGGELKSARGETPEPRQAFVGMRRACCYALSAPLCPLRGLSPCKYCLSARLISTSPSSPT